MTRLLTFLLAILISGQNPGPAITGALASGAGGGGSPATYVNAVSAETGGSSCADTISLTAGQQIAVVGMSTTASSMTITVADPDLSGITLAATSGASGASTTITIYTATVATTNATSTVSVTFSGSANYGSCTTMVFSKSAAFTFDKSSAAANTSTTSYTTGTTLTTSVATEELIACFVAPGSGETFSGGAGFTMPSSAVWNGIGQIHSGCEYRPVTTTGAYAGTATDSSATTGVGLLVTLE